MKTKSKKILYAVIAMSVACFLACSALLVIGRVDRGGEPAASAPAENGGMLIGESEGAGVSLLSEKIAKADYAAYGVSPLADSAYTLTATVEPANAADKAVDWSVAFVNPSSSWATGKTVTDYVTVTPTSDGALTATVACLQAFGEQIKVTVTHRENENATASCTVDFAKRLEGVKVANDEETTSFIFGEDETFDIEKSADVETMAFEFLYSDFTIDDTFSITMKAVIDNGFITALQEELPDESIEGTYESEITYTWSDEKFTTTQNILYKDFAFGYQKNILMLFSIDEELAFNVRIINQALYRNAVTNVMKENPSYAFCTLTITATGTHSAFSASADYMPDREKMGYSVTNISLNDTSIIF